ncbi:hypothetical protein [uncultured Alistipes sp.]|uniref:hypothetical protein n=1 Tax=uncultured Alistipes sp. TaxID=538949 RepID=UPI0026275FFB|nr:hypothetical protein [uncultured Alistipes sp.]
MIRPSKPAFFSSSVSIFLFSYLPAFLHLITSKNTIYFTNGQLLQPKNHLPQGVRSEIRHSRHLSADLSAFEIRPDRREGDFGDDDPRMERGEGYMQNRRTLQPEPQARISGNGCIRPNNFLFS